MNAKCGDGIGFDYGSVPTAGSSDQSSLAVVDLLRQASLVLDAMWREALLGPGGDAAIRFGEASHGVHRALIALDPPDMLRSSTFADAEPRLTPTSLGS